MNLKNKKIAFGLTCSFYTFKATIAEMKKIVSEGGNVIPIMSKNAYTTNNKFGSANDYIKKIELITNRKVICGVEEAEEVESDIMIIAPCSRKHYSKVCFFYL